MSIQFITLNTPLSSSATYTGPTQSGFSTPSMVFAALTDSDCTAYIDLSVDGNNWDSAITMVVHANINEIHRFTITRPYFRLRVVNGSSAQTFFRSSIMGDNYQFLTNQLNTTVQQDADALVTKSVDSEVLISAGLFEGYSIINKFGRNTDIDTGTVPEDIWNGGGIYTGFPTGAAEEFVVFSSSASDTGVLTFTYLASNTSTEWQTASVTLNGTTAVSTGITGIRMHTAQYSSGTATTFNVGEITIRHKVTTANVFCKMPIGRSQSNVAGYTVPKGYTAKIIRLFARVIGSTTGTVDGALWVRASGVSPRLRRPFTVSNGGPFEERPYGGLTITELSDIQVRISSVSTNNLDVIAGYDIILIKN